MVLLTKTAISYFMALSLLLVWISFTYLENREKVFVSNLFVYQREGQYYAPTKVGNGLQQIDFEISNHNIVNIEQIKFKTILMWGLWSSKLSDGPLVNAECPVTSCVFTPEESLFNQSDVVIFYIDSMTDFPTNRHPNQRFVFFNLESPIYTDTLKIKDHRLRYDYFNWTMTYRWDSDIVYRGDYGYFRHKKNNPRNGNIGRFFSNLSTHKTNQELVSSGNNVREFINGTFFFQNVIEKKTKLVAWFVSHCSTSIRREDYVRQLNQYVNIDIFGGCNSRECPSNCDEMLRTDYKFYIAFENSWCQDYVTEKLYRPLMYDTVPIVMGGANYNLFAPPNSYINVQDFNTPKELADYLLLLNMSDMLYAKYFEWKKDYDISLSDNYGFCDLCQMAHNESLPFKVYHDIEQWWMGKGDCKYD